MGEVMIRAGATIEIPTTPEIAALIDQSQRERYRGLKWMRLPILQATVASNKISLDDTNSGPIGPQQGYAWSLTRVVVDGLTSGATPDVVNMFRNAETSQPPLWQFNGNNFGYTWGLGQMMLLSGDSLKFQNVGSITATGLIRASGELWEVPAEMMAKLVAG